MTTSNNSQPTYYISPILDPSQYYTGMSCSSCESCCSGSSYCSGGSCLYCCGSGSSGCQIGPYISAVHYDDNIADDIFEQGDYLHHNYGKRLRFTAEGFSSSSSGFNWSTSAGGTIASDPNANPNDPPDKTIAWDQEDDFVSSVSDDIVVTCTDSVTGESASFEFAIFHLDDEDESKHNVMYVGETRTFEIAAVAWNPKTGGEVVSTTRLRGLIKNGLPEKFGNANKVKKIILRTHKYTKDYKDVLAKPYKSGVIEKVNLEVVKTRAGIQKMYVTVTAGVTPGDVNITYEMDLILNKILLIHRQHIEVKASTGAFDGVEFKVEQFQVLNKDPIHGEPEALRVIKLPAGENDYKKQYLKYDSQQPITYWPKIKCVVTNGTAAQKKAKAQQYEVGFASAVLETNRVSRYDDNSEIKTTLRTPIKDGSVTEYDPLFIRKTKESSHNVTWFKDHNKFVQLIWNDQPAEKVWYRQKNWLKDKVKVPSLYIGDRWLKDVKAQDKFCTWVVVRHKSSGQIKPLHYVLWNFDFEFKVSLVNNVIKVEKEKKALNVTAFGEGLGPHALQIGGPVPSQVLGYQYEE